MAENIKIIWKDENIKKTYDERTSLAIVDRECVKITQDGHA